MEKSDDWLKAVEIVGKILIFTPILFGLPPLIYYIFTGTSLSIGAGSNGYSAGLMIFAGLVTMLYASVRRFKEGIKYGKKEKH